MSATSFSCHSTRRPARFERRSASHSRCSSEARTLSGCWLRRRSIVLGPQRSDGNALPADRFPHVPEAKPPQPRQAPKAEAAIHGAYAGTSFALTPVNQTPVKRELGLAAVDAFSEAAGPSPAPAQTPLHIDALSLYFVAYNFTRTHK